MSYHAPKAHPFNLPPGATIPLPISGNIIYFKECDYPVELSIDGSGFEPYDLGTGPELVNGELFRNVQIRNPMAMQNTGILMYSENVRYIDNRLNIVSWRDGTAAAAVPPIVDDVQWIIEAGEAGGYHLLLPADPGRAEAWLYSDSPTNDAWWGVHNSFTPGDYRRIGQSLDGLTKIPAKCDIWVKAATDVMVGAFVLKF